MHGPHFVLDLPYWILTRDIQQMLGLGPGLTSRMIFSSCLKVSPGGGATVLFSRRSNLRMPDSIRVG